MSRKFSRDDLERFHDYDIHVPSRTISIVSVHTDIDGEESGVESALTERAIKNIMFLESISTEPITIILNTPGGDWYHGMGIYDAIKLCKSHVTIKGISQVMSMGSIIFQAADKRLLYPNAKFMIHYGWNCVQGHPKTIKNWVDEGEKVDAQMETLLLEKIKEKHPMFKLSTLKKMLDHDTILNAQETVSLGFADGIVGEDDED